MLQDLLGRKFYYLRLSLTEACNFRCQYCLPDGYKPSTKETFLSADEVQTVANAFAQLGTRKIRITGGEPTLRRDVVDITQRCASIENVKLVAMTTHGGRLVQLARPLAQVGLQQVNVSMDSLDPRQFYAITGQDKLQQVLTGIDTALSEGIQVKVNAVLMSSTTDQSISHFLRWLKLMPVTLRFIELMQTGDNVRFFSHQNVRADSLKSRLISEGWQPMERELDSGPAHEFWHPDYQGKIGLITPYAADFCNTCNRLRISALGRLHLCLFSEEGIDLRNDIRLGDVESLKRKLTGLVANKAPSHLLHEGRTGATKHLAMLGG